MADDRLPVMLQFLHISIDASGELAVGDDAAAGGATPAREPRSLLRDSRGRTYLLFAHRGASTLGRRRFTWLRSPVVRNALIAVLWVASVAGAVAAALRWGIPIAPF